MEKICLDLETALDFLRGDPGTREKLTYYADHEEVCITSLTLMHLLETLSGKHEVVNAFAASITILPFDKKAAQNVPKIMNGLRDHGDGGEITDSVLTAAICMANDAHLYTSKIARFAGIKGLKRV